MTTNILQQQLKSLIEKAPKHGVAPVVIEKAVAPVLLSVASQLAATEYYLLQNEEEDWVISILSLRSSPQVEKRAVFAFGSLEAAQQQATQIQSQSKAVKLPIIEVLWNFFSSPAVDSLIFRDLQQQNSRSIEVKRQELYNQIQQQLQKLQANSSDIA